MGNECTVKDSALDENERAKQFFDSEDSDDSEVSEYSDDEVEHEL